MRFDSPSSIVLSRLSYAADNMRVNGLFLTNFLNDGQSMRKLCHSFPNAVIEEVVSAFYEYYKSHDKKAFHERIEELDKKNNRRLPFHVYYGSDGSCVLIDYSGIPWHTDSNWDNLCYYDQKHTIDIVDEMWNDHYRRSYVEQSVADVLKDILNLCRTQRSPNYYQNLETGNKKLDTLTAKLYLSFSLNKPLDRQIYQMALHTINENLEKSFRKEIEIFDYQYIDTIMFLDDLSREIFGMIDYRIQRSFYKTQLGDEMLKFLLYTSKKFVNLDDDDADIVSVVDKLLKQIQSADCWQYAQKIITSLLVQKDCAISPMHNGFLDLNILKEKPKGMMYDGYYKEDEARLHYFGLYFGNDASNDLLEVSNF